MKKLFLSMAFAITAFTTTSAQWADGSVNNRVNPDNQSNYGYYVDTSDKGTTFVYTIVPDQGSLDMRLQIIDADGKMVLPIEGEQISNKKNRTFTSINECLLIDNKDNSAIIAVSDQRTDIDGYTLYKYNDKGEKQWECTIDNAMSLGSLACINMVACQDGGYMFAYSIPRIEAAM